VLAILWWRVVVGVVAPVVAVLVDLKLLLVFL
jgi:hypothetical protein